MTDRQTHGEKQCFPTLSGGGGGGGGGGDGNINTNKSFACLFRYPLFIQLKV